MVEKILNKKTLKTVGLAIATVGASVLTCVTQERLNETAKEIIKSKK